MALPGRGLRNRRSASLVKGVLTSGKGTLGNQSNGLLAHSVTIVNGRSKRALRTGIPSRISQALLGHLDVSTSMTYTHLRKLVRRILKDYKSLSRPV